MVGSQGGIRLDPFAIYRSLGNLDLEAHADLEAFEYRLHHVQGQGDCYDGPQQHWITALQERVPLLPTAEIALNTMLITEGIYLSDRLRREVSASEVKDSSTNLAIDI
ncbi:MAG: hypothetical protein M1281_05610 [Chloroflexi bacterium]|nr:hypothetical protein [Chloroflexota bacterium]